MEEMRELLRPLEATKATIRIEETPYGLRRSGMVIVAAQANVQDLDRAYAIFNELWRRFDSFIETENKRKEEKEGIEWNDKLVERLTLNSLASAMTTEEARAIHWPFRQMAGEDMRGKTIGEVFDTDEKKVLWLASIEPEGIAQKRAVAAAMRLVNILREEEEWPEF